MQGEQLTNVDEHEEENKDLVSNEHVTSEVHIFISTYFGLFINIKKFNFFKILNSL